MDALGDVMHKRVGLLAGLLVVALGSGVLAQEHSPEPPPWFGGRVEMPEHGFAVTVPDDWVAFDPAGDVDEQVRRTEAVLDEDVAAEVEQLFDEFSLLAALLRPAQLKMVDTTGSDLCLVGTRLDALVAKLHSHRPPAPETPSTVWLETRDELLDTYAALGDEDLSGIEGITITESPMAVELPAGATRRITFASGPDALEATMYLGWGIDSLFHMVCVGDAAPDDNWLSIAETFEFLPTEE